MLTFPATAQVQPEILAGPIVNPANWHSYYLLSEASWQDSESRAQALGGHLVTINDQSENDWVRDTFVPFGGEDRGLWIGLSDAATEGSYKWVSGQSLGYINWAFDEPNSFGGDEDYVHLLQRGSNGRFGFWNDAPNYGFTDISVNGVVEVESTPPPRKTTATAQVVNGFVVGITVTDGGFGYETPPAVLLKGGSGSGATAVATVANGVVTKITITNPGSGYTSDPVVRIATPPFTPKVGIEISKVKVSLSVVLGRKYQLESSSDLNTWTPTGSPFIAEDEELVQEFDVNQVGRFFRISQVP